MENKKINSEFDYSTIKSLSLEAIDKLNKITEKGYILIKKYIYGKISYLKDMDLTAYPAKEIKGQIINNIDYLIPRTGSATTIKYSNFFLENISYLTHTNYIISDLILPIGISFYTFQSISYLVDVYQNKIQL